MLQLQAGVEATSRERFDALRARAVVPVAPRIIIDFLMGGYLEQQSKVSAAPSSSAYGS